MKGASSIAPIGIRLPEELKSKVQERAKQHGRSMNAEIVQIIEDSFDNEGAQKAEADLLRKTEELLNIIRLKDEIYGFQERTIVAYEGQIAILEKILKERFGYVIGKGNPKDGKADAE